MKTSGDYFKIPKQKFIDDGNLFQINELSPDYDDRIKKLSENFKKIQNESKQSYVVDWQIPENL